MPGKAKRQYRLPLQVSKSLTLQVSRYCLLALHNTTIPPDRIHWPSVGIMLAYRPRRWPNNTPTQLLVKGLVFAGRGVVAVIYII